MNICGQMCEKLKQILLNIDHDLFDLLCNFREGPVAGRTNRARVYITSEAARLFLNLTKRHPTRRCNRISARFVRSRQNSLSYFSLDPLSIGRRGP